MSYEEHKHAQYPEWVAQMLWKFNLSFEQDAE